MNINDTNRLARMFLSVSVGSGQTQQECLQATLEPLAKRGGAGLTCPGGGAAGVAQLLPGVGRGKRGGALG